MRLFMHTAAGAQQTVLLHTLDHSPCERVFFEPRLRVNPPHAVVHVWSEALGRHHLPETICQPHVWICGQHILAARPPHRQVLRLVLPKLRITESFDAQVGDLQAQSQKMPANIWAGNFCRAHMSLAFCKSKALSSSVQPQLLAPTCLVNVVGHSNDSHQWHVFTLRRPPNRVHFPQWWQLRVAVIINKNQLHLVLQVILM